MSYILIRLCMSFGYDFFIKTDTHSNHDLNLEAHEMSLDENEM